MYAKLHIRRLPGIGYLCPHWFGQEMKCIAVPPFFAYITDVLFVFGKFSSLTYSLESFLLVMGNVVFLWVLLLLLWHFGID